VRSRYDVIVKPFDWLGNTLVAPGKVTVNGWPAVT